MRPVFMLASAAMFLVGCQKAGAWDSRDPVHCMTIFGVAGAGGEAQSKHALAADMDARMARLAEKNGGAAWVQQITPESRRLARRIKASAATDKDALVLLFEVCLAQHPSEAGDSNPIRNGAPAGPQ